MFGNYRPGVLQEAFTKFRAKGKEMGMAHKDTLYTRSSAAVAFDRTSLLFGRSRRSARQGLISKICQLAFARQYLKMYRSRFAKSADSSGSACARIAPYIVYSLRLGSLALYSLHGLGLTSDVRTQLMYSGRCRERISNVHRRPDPVLSHVRLSLPWPRLASLKRRLFLPCFTSPEHGVCASSTEAWARSHKASRWRLLRARGCERCSPWVCRGHWCLCFSSSVT